MSTIFMLLMLNISGVFSQHICYYISHCTDFAFFCSSKLDSLFWQSLLMLLSIRSPLPFFVFVCLKAVQNSDSAIKCNDFWKYCAGRSHEWRGYKFQVSSCLSYATTITVKQSLAMEFLVLRLSPTMLIQICI